MKTLTLFLVISIISIGRIFAQNDWPAIEKAFGKKGTIQDGVLKITYPRSDLKVKIGDFLVNPGLALTSWIGFVKRDSGSMGMNMGNQTMMMGDLVLLDKEVATVISKLVSRNYRNS